MAAPPFEDLLRACKRSALHLEMRDGYMRKAPAFVDWQAGRRLVPADRWPAWFEMIGEARGRGVDVRRARIVSEPISDYVRFEYEITEGLNQGGRAGSLASPPQGIRSCPARQ